MMRVVTTEQMRAIDTDAIAGDLAVGYSYMLKAGLGLCETVKEHLPDPAGADIAIVCGKGNNGGDGYVLGRILMDKGYRVTCFGLSAGESLQGEARQAFEEYTNKGGNSFMIDDPTELGEFTRFGLIVDGILGTGITGDPRGLAAKVIEIMNASGLPVIAVDTPSGLNNDTGETGTPTTRAIATVTMGFAKMGQFFYPGRSRVGKLHIWDLGYPEEIVAAHHDDMFVPEMSDLRAMLPTRKPSGSKFDHGLALLVCGSRGMTGAATLASSAALRTGCGMAHLATAASVVSTVAIKLTEAVIHPLPEGAGGNLVMEALEPLRALAAKMQAACIGPGLTHEEQTSGLVRRVMKEIEIPVVLDGDGLNAFKDRAGELMERRCELIVTPHAGEWARLFGPIPSEAGARVAALREKARQFSMSIVFKGNPTIVTVPDGRAYIVPVGNSGMATAGSGDVLSGMIVSLAARGCAVADAALLGASLHGLVGEITSRHLGEHSMIAGDMVEHIAEAIRPLAGELPTSMVLD
jgi:NAD(P)H-hydrate epimerase